MEPSPTPDPPPIAADPATPSRGKGFFAVCIAGGLALFLGIAYAVGYILMFHVYVTIHDSAYRVLPVGIERVETRIPDLVDRAVDSWIADRIATLYFPFMEVDGNGCRRHRTWRDEDTAFAGRVREVVGRHYHVAVYRVWCDEDGINVIIDDKDHNFVNMVSINPDGTVTWLDEPVPSPP